MIATTAFVVNNSGFYSYKIQQGNTWFWVNDSGTGSANVVVDDATFFTSTTGIFDLSANKTLVYFRVYFNGTATGAKYVSGSGFLTNLAPKVSPTAPVWVTPLTISVDGDLASGTV